VELELAVSQGLWRAFEKEAERQGASVPQMAEHAVLYFAAQLDAGHITQRILDDLEDEDTEEGPAA
jgi:hypothetical protein